MDHAVILADSRKLADWRNQRIEGNADEKIAGIRNQAFEMTQAAIAMENLANQKILEQEEAKRRGDLEASRRAEQERQLAIDAAKKAQDLARERAADAERAQKNKDEFERQQRRSDEAAARAARGEKPEAGDTEAIDEFTRLVEEREKWDRTARTIQDDSELELTEDQERFLEGLKASDPMSYMAYIKAMASPKPLSPRDIFAYSPISLNGIGAEFDVLNEMAINAAELDEGRMGRLQINSVFVDSVKNAEISISKPGLDGLRKVQMRKK